IIRLMARRMSNPRLFAIPRLMIAEAGNFPELAQLYRKEVIERGFSLVESILQKGIERNLFRPMNTRHAARNIIGPLIVNFLLANVFRVDADGTATPDQFAESHLNILFNGLLAEPRGA
ncbi:MAG: TetR/AcrR family transcriptional regulator C-terminal domain-containing protein, partial [Fimbriimonadaceae bacterium]|nr:TetR/AcrR family transcriptional regulator C-terminal domain-containing protein [Alphaproteobacteria bacterium]